MILRQLGRIRLLHRRNALNVLPTRKFAVGPKLVDSGLIRAYTYFAAFILGGMGYGYMNEMPFSGYIWIAPFLRFFSAETQFDSIVSLCRLPYFCRRLLGMVDRIPNAKILQQDVWETHFDNPLGLAANFCPSGKATDACMKFGFGFLECGTVSPLGQEKQDKMMLERVGEKTLFFENWKFAKHDDVKITLEKRLDYVDFNTAKLGMNLGVSSNAAGNPIVDYRMGIKKLLRYSDYVVINVRDLIPDHAHELEEILSSVKESVYEEGNKEFKKRAGKLFNCEECLPPSIPFLAKIPIDYENDEELRKIITCCQNAKVDGIIIDGASTNVPESLQDDYEEGGDGYFMGKLTFDRSNEILSKVFEMTDGKLPLIGGGGVMNGQTAYEKIKNGATFIQLFSVIIHRSPRMVQSIKTDLEKRLENDGFENISEAIGLNHPEIHARRLKELGSTWKPKVRKVLNKDNGDPYYYKRNRQSRLKRLFMGDSKVRGYATKVEDQELESVTD